MVETRVLLSFLIMFRPMFWLQVNANGQATIGGSIRFPSGSVSVGGAVSISGDVSVASGSLTGGAISIATTLSAPTTLQLSATGGPLIVAQESSGGSTLLSLKEGAHSLFTVRPYKQRMSCASCTCL